MVGVLIAFDGNLCSGSGIHKHVPGFKQFTNRIRIMLQKTMRMAKCCLLAQNKPVQLRTFRHSFTTFRIFSLFQKTSVNCMEHRCSIQENYLSEATRYALVRIIAYLLPKQNLNSLNLRREFSTSALHRSEAVGKVHSSHYHLVYTCKVRSTKDRHI